jgi:hypothetical protein
VRKLLCVPLCVLLIVLLRVLLCVLLSILRRRCPTEAAETWWCWHARWRWNTCPTERTETWWRGQTNWRPAPLLPYCWCCPTHRCWLLCTWITWNTCGTWHT